MAKRKRASLSELSVEEFMSGWDEDQDGSKVRPRKRRAHSSSSSEEDEGSSFEDLSSGEEDLGVVEPRPLHVTSRKETQEEEEEEEEEEASSEDELEDEGRSKVTVSTMEGWAAAIREKHSLRALSQLCVSLHSSLSRLMEDHALESSSFNHLLVLCLKYVEPCVSHYLTSSSSSQPLSSHPNWHKLKRTLKPYFSDVLVLLQTLKEPSMQLVMVQHIHCFIPHFACFPKLTAQLHKLLVTCWSSGEAQVQVVAFMALRRMVQLNPQHMLSLTLKKVYLAYVSNCKFTSLQTLPSIEFMQNCLVEFLSMDGQTCYQHGFVYIRQLSLTLRATLTANKKTAYQNVYNWQYVHCVELWCHALKDMTFDPTVRPLIYPLVQVALGVITLCPTVKFFPLRLRLLRSLVHLGTSTNTYIPLLPYLLEVMEKCGGGVSSHMTTGKPPSLQVMIKASKQDLTSRAYHSAVLNEAYELMLLFFTGYQHTISFPELSFPVIDKLKKLCKTTPHSWFRLHLKQFFEKVEEVCKDIKRERESVNFSPTNLEKISIWEKKRKEIKTPLGQLLVTWAKVHDKQAIEE